MSHSTARRTDLSDDEQVEPPFRFQDLPGEVRNQIYKILPEYNIELADSRACLAEPSRNRKYERYQRDASMGILHATAPQPTLPLTAPRLTILQPGLFLTCRQIRTEGLVFFYQKRKFSFDLNGGSGTLHKFGPLGFSTWFEAIGKFGQQNIRYLQFYNAPSQNSRSKTCVYRRLSETATVTYSVDLQNKDQDWHYDHLWMIADRYARNPNKMPVLRNADGIVKFADLKVPWLLDYSMPFELRLEPGCNWFGPYPLEKRIRSDEAGCMGRR